MAMRNSLESEHKKTPAKKTPAKKKPPPSPAGRRQGGKTTMGKDDSKSELFFDTPETAVKELSVNSFPSTRQRLLARSFPLTRRQWDQDPNSCLLVAGSLCVLVLGNTTNTRLLHVAVDISKPFVFIASMTSETAKCRGSASC